jgi:hypothetical protein
MLYLDDRRVVRLREDIQTGAVTSGKTLHLSVRNDQEFLLQHYSETLGTPIGDDFDTPQELQVLSVVVDQLILLCQYTNRRIFDYLEGTNLPMETFDHYRAFIEDFVEYDTGADAAGVLEPLAREVLGSVKQYLVGLQDRGGDNWLTASPDAGLLRIWVAPALLKAAASPR